MDARQRARLLEIADDVAAYRAGRSSLLDLLNNAWGRFEAADIRDPRDRQQFQDVYYALSVADDRFQPWIPADVMGSEEDVRAALARFASWIEGLREDAAGS